MTAQNTELLECVVRAADDRLAKDIVALDMAGLTTLADYFVIATANNERQVNAIADAVEEAVYKHGFDVKQIEGRQAGKWVLIDCHDVIVHIFQADERERYNLEKLWHEAPLLNLNDWLS
ncbi:MULTISPECIES: ribosome silencing factor [Aerococcus]|uniref:Ribosomal silencing factor RsfS n=1 Tax=Aerococcus sanguinicola TaxID=119206 RepID=A0A5N1GQ64_9LACT|nr:MULTISPECIES: ribosome silencing factor [Aerococcus]KAA9300860.1 ribosome silencing factor [Aerococcus sanguinicola]MDK6369090.1 ribosome silencing factor [Aerococcus sp. UMB9870]MDK6679851.1 ribosome silencing factor [Aerococcus sp. UMB8608]MDK6686583.1 ribosome silencing factor [Aerococcus sp. UMB8623]MDK6939773.1 ribosome silencing factor [Aerococcus sp. UMB8487]